MKYSGVIFPSKFNGLSLIGVNFVICFGFSGFSSFLIGIISLGFWLSILNLTIVWISNLSFFHFSKNNRYNLSLDNSLFGINKDSSCLISFFGIIKGFAILLIIISFSFLGIKFLKVLSSFIISSFSLFK